MSSELPKRADNSRQQGVLAGLKAFVISLRGHCE